MSKTVSSKSASAGFRSIDVDQLYHAFKEEDENIEPNADMPTVDDSKISNLCMDGNHLAVIQYIFSFNAHQSRNQKLKDICFQHMMSTMLAVKTPDIDKIVNALDSDQLDLLMKYIYRGFENPVESSSAAMLSWHLKVLAKAGVGSIVRVITDRKRV